MTTKKLFTTLIVSEEESITLYETNGMFEIVSTVEHGTPGEPYDAACDGIESFVLACAVNGVPFMPQFRQAVRDAFEAIANQLA